MRYDSRNITAAFSYVAELCNELITVRSIGSSTPARGHSNTRTAGADYGNAIGENRARALGVKSHTDNSEDT
jgi:hypothetical protein